MYIFLFLDYLNNYNLLRNLKQFQIHLIFF